MKWTPFILCLVTFACGDEDTNDLSCDQLTLELCNIEATECQEHVFQVTACVRGFATMEPPSVRTISVEEYQDMLMASELSESEKNQDAQLTILFKMLRFLPENISSNNEADIADQAAHVAAYYSTQTQEVTIIDHDEPFEQKTAVYILSHEFVHAQQDIDIGIASFVHDFATTSDQFLAVLSLIEGEAVHYSNLALAQMPDATITHEQFMAYYDSWQAELIESANDPDEVYQTITNSFPYPFGGDYFTNAWYTEGSEAAFALYEAPPLSTATLMRASQGLSANPIETISAPEPPLPDHYKITIDDTLGAWMLYIFLVRNGIETDLAWSSAHSARGDLALLATPETGDDIAFRWQIRWADSDTPQLLAQELMMTSPAYGGAWSVVAHGPELSLLAVSNPDDLQTWIQIFEQSQNKLTKPYLEARANASQLRQPLPRRLLRRVLETAS